MKHLRRFNENKEILDIDYIKQCFIDLIENEEYAGGIDTTNYNSDEDTQEEGDLTYCSFYCYEPSINIDTKSEEEYYEFISELNEFSSELKSAIARLKDEYPDYKIEFHTEAETKLLMKNLQRTIIIDISI
jgi:hypothetical protein